MEINNRDPYFRVLYEWKDLKRLRGDSIKTGRISTEGELGNFTGIQNIVLECLPLALKKTSSASAWKILNYLEREILGRTRDKDGNPKTFIKYKPNHIMRKACINSPTSLYRAFEILVSKNIIFIEDKERIYFNIFPLSWDINDENDKNSINQIMEKEIGRIYSKIERARNE